MRILCEKTYVRIRATCSDSRRATRRRAPDYVVSDDIGVIGTFPVSESRLNHSGPISHRAFYVGSGTDSLALSNRIRPHSNNESHTCYLLPADDSKPIVIEVMSTMAIKECDVVRNELRSIRPQGCGLIDRAWEFSAS